MGVNQSIDVFQCVVSVKLSCWSPFILCFLYLISRPSSGLLLLAGLLAEALITGSLETVKRALPLVRRVRALRMSPVSPHFRATLKAVELGIGGAGVHSRRHSEHHGKYNDDNVNELFSLFHFIEIAARHEHDALVVPRSLVL